MYLIRYRTIGNFAPHATRFFETAQEMQAMMNKLMGSPNVTQVQVYSIDRTWDSKQTWACKQSRKTKNSV